MTDYQLRDHPTDAGWQYPFSWHYHGPVPLRPIIGLTDTPTPLPDCAAAGCPSAGRDVT